MNQLPSSCSLPLSNTLTCRAFRVKLRSLVVNQLTLKLMGSTLTTNNVKQLMRETFLTMLTDRTLQRIITTLNHCMINVLLPTNLHTLLKGSPNRNSNTNIPLTRGLARKRINKVRPVVAALAVSISSGHFLYENDIRNIRIFQGIILAHYLSYFFKAGTINRLI